MGSIGSVGSAGSASTNPKAGTTAPPQPLAYGSFTAADKQAAIDNVKPAASKKGVFSNKQREKQAGGAKTPQVETLHEDVVVGGTKPKPHSEGKLLVTLACCIVVMLTFLVCFKSVFCVNVSYIVIINF